MALSHMVRASRIVLALVRPREQPMRTTVVDAPGGPGEAHIYEPVGKAYGAVVVVPGLATLAHNDPRLHNLAKAFARGGMRGIVLEVPDLSELRIRPETDQDVADRLHAVVQAGLVPEGRLGLLGPSFSGSLALRAAALEPAVEHVKSVITVGAYADAAPTVDYLFHNPQADPYGRMLLMYNFLDRVEPVSQALHDALYTAILDTSRAPENAELPALMATLDEATSARLHALLNEPAAWQHIGDGVLEEGKPVFASLSVPPIAKDLRCSVFVLHGTSDNIVPASQSVDLHEGLRAAGVDTHLVVSSVLGHADIEAGLSAAREGLRIVKGFAHFVKGMG